jgi:hypothetical protein
VTNKLGSVPQASKRLSLPAVATLVVIKDEAAKSLLPSGADDWCFSLKKITLDPTLVLLARPERRSPTAKAIPGVYPMTALPLQRIA